LIYILCNVLYGAINNDLLEEESIVSKDDFVSKTY